jgi:hypothetical protein
MSYDGANWTRMNCKTKHGLYNKVKLPKLIKALESTGVMRSTLGNKKIQSNI